MLGFCGKKRKWNGSQIKKKPANGVSLFRMEIFLPRKSPCSVAWNPSATVQPEVTCEVWKTGCIGVLLAPMSLELRFSSQSVCEDHSLTLEIYLPPLVPLLGVLIWCGEVQGQHSCAVVWKDPVCSSDECSHTLLQNPAIWTKSWVGLVTNDLTGIETSRGIWLPIVSTKKPEHRVEKVAKTSQI